MDVPAFNRLLETLHLAALTVGCVGAAVGTVFCGLGKRAERPPRGRRGAWNS